PASVVTSLDRPKLAPAPREPDIAALCLEPGSRARSTRRRGEALRVPAGRARPRRALRWLRRPGVPVERAPRRLAGCNRARSQAAIRAAAGCESKSGRGCWRLRARVGRAIRDTPARRPGGFRAKVAVAPRLASAPARAE